MLITGIHKDYDITDRLNQLSVPTLFVCGRHGSTRPEETAWYHSLVPGAELVVFEYSSHLPRLEERKRTCRRCAASCTTLSEPLRRRFVHGRLPGLGWSPSPGSRWMKASTRVQASWDARA